MAPEQALGEAVTPAADLYGVGVMLYEMLTGLHPFDVPDRMAMLSFHIVAPVPAMRDRAPNVDVPPLVEAVVRTLLEKDAKKRHGNARALIEAIESAASGSGIDLGLGGPPTPPMPPSQRGPGWGVNDAFAQTSIGLPAATSTRDITNVTTGSGDPSASPAPPGVRANSAGARALLDLLARQPRNVQYGLAAAVPLGLILVVVVLVLVFRGPKQPDGERVTTKEGISESAPVAKGKTAPPDRVTAAVALGPEALDALAKEFPEDSSILQKLALAYQAQGKTAEAMKTVRALLAADPSAAEDDDIVQLVTTTASKGRGTDDDEAFALLEGPLGERGVDALIDMSTRAPGRENRGVRDHRLRAAKSLAKPEVRSHASAAAAVLMELKAAQTCAAKHDLLARAKDKGDARVLALLKPLKNTRGCGGFFRGGGDCHPCMRADTALDDAIDAIESRTAPSTAPSAAPK
jgi:serine/threonine-protein kinase